MSCKSVSVVLVFLGCLLLKEAFSSKARIGAIVCSDKQHYTAGRGVSCCEHKHIAPGIVSEKMQGHDPSTDEKENLTMSAWRVYGNLLATHLPKDQKTITLTKFTELMIKAYPDKLKKEITETVDKLKSAEGKEKKWLDSEINLRDYENINRMRVTFFNIQKHACGKKPHAGETTHINMWDDCHELNEKAHRDGGCCKNQTLPIHVHDHHDDFLAFKHSTCDKTLAPLAKKLQLTKKEDIDTLSEECHFACFMVDKKHIDIDSLLNMKVTTKVPTDKVVDVMAPVYLSKAMTDYMKEYLRDHVNMTKIIDFVPDTILGDLGKAEDILPCYVYQVVNHVLHNSLHEYCYPHYEHEDFKK